MTAASTLLAHVELAPRDPILGITDAFNQDANPRKVNLGVGVYTDENGKVPLLECVRQAESQMAAIPSPRSYLPIDGLVTYDRLVQHLVFGAQSPEVIEARTVTVQALGGTGGLRIGADFLARFSPGSEVWISDPSWENHRALFEAAGFTVRNYPYYDAATHGVDFPALIAALEGAPAGTIIVLHACCHNPSGVDLSSAQWGTVIDVVGQRDLIPFLDLAYQGFANSIEEDGAVVRRFAATGRPLLVSNSFSKSFSLYGERVGAFSLVTASKDDAQRALSQLKRIVRTNYSNPPAHGAQVVAAVLGNADLRALWEQELGGMRDRIKRMRALFVEKLRAKAPQHDFSFVARQSGMFSYSGLSKAQVERMRAEFSVYAIDTGRICVAAMNEKNLDAIVDAVAAVL
jgi:aromatic-amino-acid transaminase